MIGAVACLLLTLAAATEDLSVWIERLESGRFEAVSRARLALLNAPPAEAHAALVEGLETGRPLVRARCADLLVELGDDTDAELVLDLLSREREGRVQERLVWALARLGDVAAEMAARFESGALSAELFELYQRERLLQLLQRTLRDGTIPGFYDGQFDALSPLQPGLVDQLLFIGAHPSLNASLRGMAVAAIGSHGDREDVSRLQEVFMVDPRTEIEHLVESTEETEERARAQLSQYARWSAWRLGDKVLPLEPINELQRRHDQIQSKYHPRAPEYLFQIGYGYLRLRLLDKAEQSFSRFVDEYEGTTIQRFLSSVHYNLACIHALRSEVGPAIQELRLARENGFTDIGWLLEDRDLEKIRDDPRFRAFLEEK